MKVRQTVTALLLAGIGLGGAIPASVQDAEALRIWKEFVSDLRAGKMENPERHRLLNPAWNDTFVGWMKTFREYIDWEKSSAVPEVFRVGNEIKYVMPVWQSRASAAGWKLAIAEEAGETVFRFSRETSDRMFLPPAPEFAF